MRARRRQRARNGDASPKWGLNENATYTCSRRATRLASGRRRSRAPTIADERRARVADSGQRAHSKGEAERGDSTSSSRRRDSATTLPTIVDGARGARTFKSASSSRRPRGVFESVVVEPLPARRRPHLVTRSRRRKRVAALDERLPDADGAASPRVIGERGRQREGPRRRAPLLVDVDAS